MKTYQELQQETLAEARRLASNGEEFANLVALLSPDNALRLKIYVQSLPESVASMTIYGRAHTAKLPDTKKRRKMNEK
jgi:hypothetical protein